MSFVREVELGRAFGPSVSFREHFGLVPNLFQAQSLLPRAIEAQARIAGAILLTERALSRKQKEQILLLNAAARENAYCLAMHSAILLKFCADDFDLTQFIADYHRAGLPAEETSLLDFSLKLGMNAPSIAGTHIEELRRQELADEAILEAILVTALSRFLCTLSEGLGPELDFEKPDLPRMGSVPHLHGVGGGHPEHSLQQRHPYLRSADPPNDFGPFEFFRQSFGFVPNIFRAQMLRPDVVEAEAQAIASILLPQDLLSRVQKECILLVLSAANFNTYCVAVHCEMLRGLGMPPEESDQIVLDHHLSGLSNADKLLLDFALKLGARPGTFDERDIEVLRQHGFREEQILEAVVMTAMTNFLNTLQVGLGTVPDYEPRINFAERLLSFDFDSQGRISDADAEWAANQSGAALAAKTAAGDLQAFEQLVRQCGRRVYRTLVAVLGDTKRAETAIDGCFLTAYQRIRELRDPAHFSVRLISMAKETALAYASARGGTDDPFANSEDEEALQRPRELFTWPKDVGRLYSRSETQDLVQNAVMKLPPKYRVVVVLRDLERLSVAVIAEACGISPPVIRKRLAQGRMMLMELLAPVFAEKTRRAAS